MSLSVSIYIISSFLIFRKGGVEKFEKSESIEMNTYVHDCTLDISALMIYNDVY